MWDIDKSTDIIHALIKLNWRFGYEVFITTSDRKNHYFFAGNFIAYKQNRNFYNSVKKKFPKENI